VEEVTGTAMRRKKNENIAREAHIFHMKSMRTANIGS
jgi:hypothetical protein